MTSALRLTASAERDLTAAYRWYEGQRSDLGLEFLDEFITFSNAFGNCRISFL